MILSVLVSLAGTRHSNGARAAVAGLKGVVHIDMQTDCVDQFTNAFPGNIEKTGAEAARVESVGSLITGLGGLLGKNLYLSTQVL